MRLASYELTIDAPIDVVWAHLTTPAGFVRWVGPDAKPIPYRRSPALDPTERRDRRRTIPRARPSPSSRLRVRLGGRADGRAPESTTVEIDLEEEDGATTVRLVHHGLPPEAVDDHEQGWEYFLGALRKNLS